MGDFQYARQKIISATSVLATHPGDIKVRLRTAYLDHLALAFVGDLPEELQPLLQSIHDRMTAKEERWRGQGTVDATLLGMHRKTASKIAESIWGLFRSVIEL